MRHAALRNGPGPTWPGTPSSASPVRLRARRSRRRTALPTLLALSLLMHMTVMLALLVLSQPRPRVPDVAEPGTVDVVMLPPPGVAEVAPFSEPDATSTTPEPTPTIPTPPEPESPPAPEVSPSPPVASIAPAAPEPLPAPEPSAAPEAPPQEQLPPPPAAPPEPEVPAPPLPTPPAAPPEPEESALPLPLPPPRALPAPSRPAPARPSPFPRPVARSLADLGAELRTPPPPQPARPPPQRGFNLALGPEARASNGAMPRASDANTGLVRFEGVDLGEDWVRALHAWWDRHRYYPNEAAMQGEDGTTGLRVRMDRSGHVLSVELELRSGSQWLDLASLAIFRDAHLPPFPVSTPQSEATLHLTINFILVRQRGG
jgi:protein TonB